MFFPQLDWFSFSDRLFFVLAVMLPMAVIIFGISLVIEYNVEMRKRKNRKRR